MITYCHFQAFSLEQTSMEAVFILIIYTYDGCLNGTQNIHLYIQWGWSYLAGFYL